SITQVNSALVVKIDMSRAVRGDQGHFDGASEAARHWDAEEGVDATCSRCHSTPGPNWNLLDVKSTAFPGGTSSMLAGNDNLCGNCHSGRVAKSDIDKAIAANKLGFLNVHYLPAAATRQGSAAKVGYEYDGKSYAGPLKHTGGVQRTSCHAPV